jgi:hypothetical protein
MVYEASNIKKHCLKKSKNSVISLSLGKLVVLLFHLVSGSASSQGNLDSSVTIPWTGYLLESSFSPQICYFFYMKMFGSSQSGSILTLKH